MKNKGLLIALAVVSIAAIVALALFAGFFWGRSWPGVNCCGNWSRGYRYPASGRGGMWGGRGMFYGNNYDLHNYAASERVLSIPEADAAVNAYINDYKADENLYISEIMIFDNHAYAVIKEEESEIGAFEVLVDPETLNVLPEMGPNRMWNLKYSPMRSEMMRGGFNDTFEEMPISDEEALDIANEYLAQNNSDLIASGHPDRFYGYYTIHTEKDGNIYGMLSVNGYDGEIFLHTWHGEFIEMTDHTEDGHTD